MCGRSKEILEAEMKSRLEDEVFCVGQEDGLNGGALPERYKDQRQEAVRNLFSHRGYT